MDVTGVPAMYVFVDIGIDVQHLVESVRFNFPPGARLSLAGTIQFASSIQARRYQCTLVYLVGFGHFFVRP